MAGRGNKQGQDNFAKLKREMTSKKKKAEALQTVDIAPDQPADSAVPEELRLDCLEQPGTGEHTKAAQDKSECDNIACVTDEKPAEAAQDKPECDNIACVTDKKPEDNNQEDRQASGKIELIVFRAGEEEFALRISRIKEIIRVPALTKIPNAPYCVAGLCSLRGELLPVVDGRKLFGMPEREPDEGSRIIVADMDGEKVGLISDRVSEVISLEETAVKVPPASLRGVDGGVVSGILILDQGKRVVILLDPANITKLAGFSALESQRCALAGVAADRATEQDEEEQIVIFQIGQGEYAFNIHCVKEIIRLPAITKVPNTANHIVGMLSIRNQLLAVIHPGKLLGICGKQPDEYSRVILVDNGDFSYGVIVERVSHVIPVKKALFRESVQLAGCSYVEGVFTLNGGKRLVMALQASALVTLDEMKAVLPDGDRKADHPQAGATAEAGNDLAQIVVFRLGNEEYGIEINQVREINRLSEITHLPGAPACIDGMVDLRGEIIPILNLRSLFAVSDSDAYPASKFLVVEFGNQRIGILIDSASEVLRFSKDHLEETPAALMNNGAQEGCIEKIVRLNEGKRIVLLLKLSALLSFM